MCCSELGVEEPKMAPESPQWLLVGVIWKRKNINSPCFSLTADIYLLGTIGNETRLTVVQLNALN